MQIWQAHQVTLLATVEVKTQEDVTMKDVTAAPPEQKQLLSNQMPEVMVAMTLMITTAVTLQTVQNQTTSIQHQATTGMTNTTIVMVTQIPTQGQHG